MRKKNDQTQWGFLGNLGVGAQETSASLLGSTSAHGRSQRSEGVPSQGPAQQDLKFCVAILKKQQANLFCIVL